MGTAISLRDDFDGTALRQLARKSKSANQARRLLALAEIYDGGSRTSAARMQAIAEILGPVQNPRYLLVRTSWLGLKRRVDYHAVPISLGTRKEYAEHGARIVEKPLIGTVT